MTVEEAKERINSEAFVKWMSFFKAEKDGGPRTLHDEIMDFLAARAAAMQVNTEGIQKQTHEFMLFADPETVLDQKRGKFLAIMNSIIERK